MFLTVTFTADGGAHIGVQCNHKDLQQITAELSKASQLTAAKTDENKASQVQQQQQPL